MTREEASNILDDFDVNFEGHTTEEISEAFDVAFKALSQEPCERFEWGIDGKVYKITKAKDGKEICQQVCDDAVSREAVIKTINNNTADERDGWLCIDNDLVHEIEKLPSVNPQPCEDAISREAVLLFIEKVKESGIANYGSLLDIATEVRNLPPVTQKPKIGHCKECKYFEYDSVAKVDGVPLIVAHEICSKWGDGCKTKEDGYCFLYEPQAESEE